MELALEAWPDRSQRQITEQIRCSQGYVSRIREQVITGSHLPDRTIGKDGEVVPGAANIPEGAASEENDATDRQLDADGTNWVIDSQHGVYALPIP